MSLRKQVRKLPKAERVKLIVELGRKDPSNRQAIQDFLQCLRHSPATWLRHFSSCFRRRCKRPGQKPGHPGQTRPKPERIDRVVDSTLSRCTRCQTPLGRSLGVSEHIQEDLIPAPGGGDLL